MTFVWIVLSYVVQIFILHHFWKNVGFKMKMEIIESDLKQLFQWIKTLENRVIAIEKSVGYAKIEADNK